MRLRPRLIVMFVSTLVLINAFIIFLFPPMAERVTMKQLFSLARTVGIYFVHDLEGLPYTGDEAAFEKAVSAQFDFVSTLAAETQEFTVRKIILVRPDMRVEIGNPSSEKGQDYSSHPDVVEAIDGTPLQVVIEKEPTPDGREETYADIVAPVRLADGDSGAVEIKLDLTATLAQLRAGYRNIELLIVLVILVAFVGITAILLYSVGRTVIRPILRFSEAMEKVGKGDLDVRLGMTRSDEIGDMAGRFDEMVTGLKERFELSHYVSKSTFGAVRQKVTKGGAGAVEKRRLTLFFSDVRNFTAYAEHTAPERVIAVLNSLLGLQEKIIAREGGEVDKYVGDETMAIFVDPAGALRAALKVHAAAEKASASLDNLRLGIGLHIGELVEGDIGSPSMMDHTVIGDTVNTAARIEAAAKPGQILVSEELACEPGIADLFEFQGTGTINAKGKSQPVKVRGLRGLKPKA